MNSNISAHSAAKVFRCFFKVAGLVCSPLHDYVVAQRGRGGFHWMDEIVEGNIYVLSRLGDKSGFD